MSSPEQEYRVLTQAAGIVDLGRLGTVLVTGQDRTAVLHNVLSQDIRSMAAGESRQAALLTPQGKVLAHLLVQAQAEAHLLIVLGGTATGTVQALDRYIIMEDAACRDTSAATHVFGLWGPATPSLKDLPGPTIPFPLGSLPGSLLLARRDEEVSVLAALPVGWEAFTAARIEAGWPWYGVDMNDTTLLPETGLEQVAVSYTKGCYVGQEIVARMDAYGSASRKLMGMLMEGPQVPMPADAILKDGQPVGEITSAAYSWRLKRGIALGYVKRPHYEPGTAVTVAGRTATLTALPFPAAL